MIWQNIQHLSRFGQGLHKATLPLHLPPQDLHIATSEKNVQSTRLIFWRQDQKISCRWYFIELQAGAGNGYHEISQHRGATQDAGRPETMCPRANFLDTWSPK